MGNEKDYFGFSKGINDYYNHYVSVADAKAAAVIAISFLLFDFIISLVRTTYFQDILFYIVSIALALTCLFSLISVFPRNPKEKKGLIYWENVKNYKDKNEYFNDIKKLSKKDIEEKYSTQNFIISKILNRKHFFIRLAIISFIFALSVLSILYVLINNA